MKLSANTIGAVLFTVAGIALFVLMAKRMPEEGADKSAMNFGMPISGEVSGVVEDKMPEPSTSEVAPNSTESTISSMPEAEAPVIPKVEPVKEEEIKVEESTAMPSTTPSTTEIKTEEMPTTPVDAPTVEGSMPAN